MTTHVALVRHHQTGAVEPASFKGAVIVGTKDELTRYFPPTVLLGVEPKTSHVQDREQVDFADWVRH